MSSLQQVKGRGIRYKSHKDPNAVVKVFVYFAKKCDSTSNSKPSPRTQSMDVILWFLNKKKQKTIDTFADRILIPSSIENAKFSFIEKRKDLDLRIIDDAFLTSEDEESNQSKNSNLKKSSKKSSKKYHT